MIERPFWIQRIEQAWQKAPIVWLTGVRRAGKTTLTRHWQNAAYFNCDLPRNRDLLSDPESLLHQVDQTVVIFDEIHQLENPSEVLKIAADEFPQLRILATGSSTLSATQKFKDSLTGRKRVVHLLPVLASELKAFNRVGIQDRLVRGGLPQALLTEEPDPEFYSEWLDSFFARDVQELFQVGKRHEFLTLCELVLRESGELISQTSLSKHTALSRPTVINYLNILEVTHFIHQLRPYHAGGRRELLAQPKVYAFDTGFITHFNSWQNLRPQESGRLLEHLVLDMLRAHFPQQPVYFWRDKQQREIDFVLPQSDGSLTAIECKWSRTELSQRNLDAFRNSYPNGKNLLVIAGTGDPFEKEVGDHRVRICQLNELVDLLKLA